MHSLIVKCQFYDHNATTINNISLMPTSTVVARIKLMFILRATVIALERNGKKTENGNAFRQTRFLNLVLY